MCGKWVSIEVSERRKILGLMDQRWILAKQALSFLKSKDERRDDQVHLGPNGECSSK